MVMGARETRTTEAEVALDLLERTEQLYKDYLNISVIADLSQLLEASRQDQAVVYGQHVPVGLVVTGG